MLRLMMLDSVSEPLSVQIIRELHRILKMNTTPVARGWLILGQWKRLSNKVEEAETTSKIGRASCRERV